MTARLGSLRQGWLLGACSLSLVACSTGTDITDRDADFIWPDGAVMDSGETSQFTDSSVRDAGPPGDAGMGCVTEELCDDGLDNDCDDVIEEGCACLPGTTARCFRGPALARGMGACVDGTMTCEDGLEFGTWGACEGDVLPADEVCDADGVDESCDGAANEGCDCSPGDPPAACGSDVGACIPGTQPCEDGRLGACTGATGPGEELCNDIDDDCDGAVDEGLTRACGTDTGECRAGVETCTAGVFEACVGSIETTAELCDGLDNDCDGDVDEELTRACGSSVGECAPGTQTCTDAEWSTCGGETLPLIEGCNDLDDDCDGRVDEGVSRACGISTGICSPGSQACSGGVFGLCTGGVGPSLEACDGSDDDDCDGTVDEGCDCSTGATRACGTNTGECVAGTQTCDGTGDWGGCVGSTSAVPEVCNTRDDDCDGSTDEDGVCPTSPPVVSCPGAITAEVLSTVGLSGSGSDPDGGVVTYRWTVTSRPGGSVSSPSAPNSASTNFYLDASGAFTLQLCVTDDEGEMACCSTNVTSTAPGAIHVELSWNTAYGDVDLHLLNVTQSDPNGWFTTNDCYWNNVAPDWAPGGARSNPTLDIDDTDGFGPENITIDDTPSAGTYTVGAHYYCSRSIGTSPAPGDGPTEATARVYCDGNLIATYTGLELDETDDWLTIATVDYPACTSTRRTRSTNGSSILPAAFTTFPAHCTILCSNNADCPAGERCATVSGGGPPRNQCVLDR